MTKLSRRTLLAAGATAVPAAALASLPALPAAGAADPVAIGTVPAQLAKLDSMLKAFITSRSVSCAQLAVSRNGKILMARGYGTYRYNSAPTPS
ncbi:serine hydrolase, partial [Nonomuraea sp. NN258]|nr:serine hydrolase [Nonomuraea antri]